MLKIANFDLLNDDYESVILERIKSDYGKEDIEGGTYYEVTLQNQFFACAYSDNEMRGIIGTCINIIKELIKIQDNGFTRARFDEICSSDNDNKDSISAIYRLYNDIQTPTLRKLIMDMAKYTRIRSAYFMFISSPILIGSIYCVFDKMLDDYDDEDMWFSCLYFLIRGAMKMHSQDLSSSS